MKAKNNFRMNSSQRSNRYFSTEFKMKKVKEIETGRSKISEVCKEYEVSSTSVYRWIKKYGRPKEKNERIIIESKSDTQLIMHLRSKIAELEQLVGQKEVLISFKEKMLDYAQEYCGVDIKKKFLNKASTTSGKTGEG
jgi:transposase-like protein